VGRVGVVLFQQNGARLLPGGVNLRKEVMTIYTLNKPENDLKKKFDELCKKHGEVVHTGITWVLVRSNYDWDFMRKTFEGVSLVGLANEYAKKFIKPAQQGERRVSHGRHE